MSVTFGVFPGPRDANSPVCNDDKRPHWSSSTLETYTMSRRQSRVSLADRQNEALQEFESRKLFSQFGLTGVFMNELGLSLDTTVKRKYLQYNKQIIKENSNLRVQVEELKSQISQLYVENLALGRSNIALEKQLKREKARRKSGGDPKTIKETDKLVSLSGSSFFGSGGPDWRSYRLWK